MSRFVVEVEVDCESAGDAAQFVAFALQEQDMGVFRIRAEAAPVVPVGSGRTFAEAHPANPLNIFDGSLGEDG